MSQLKVGEYNFKRAMDEIAKFQDTHRLAPSFNASDPFIAREKPLNLVQHLYWVLAHSEVKKAVSVKGREQDNKKHICDKLLTALKTASFEDNYAHIFVMRQQLLSETNQGNNVIAKQHVHNVYDVLEKSDLSETWSVEDFVQLEFKIRCNRQDVTAVSGSGSQKAASPAVALKHSNLEVA